MKLIYAISLKNGTHSITAGYSGDANNAPSNSSPLRQLVNKSDQTITFGPAPTVIVDGTGKVSAKVGDSGNPVTFSSLTPGVCTVSDSTVIGVMAGDCTIAANQAGNANYNAAPQATQSFAVGPSN